MHIYCTYITIYLGNKLPPFYVGFSNISKIQKGYHGTVVSKKYSKIWKEEIKNNPHLFKTIILTLHYSKEEAKEKESYLQRFFKVNKNPMYINMSINGEKYTAPWEDNDYRNYMLEIIKTTHEEGKIWTPERRLSQSEHMKQNSRSYWNDQRKENQSKRNKEKFDNYHFKSMSSKASKDPNIIKTRSKNMSKTNNIIQKCSVCGYEGNPGVIGRYHNHNCKKIIDSSVFVEAHKES